MMLDGVSVCYKTFVAVADVRMPIYTNQITAIIGPSGCGKSHAPARAQPHERPDPRRSR